METDANQEFIGSLAKFGSRPGLECVTELLRRVGGPQHGHSFIHVAGTNGKGTTAQMLAGALTAAGYKTGLFMSPSVVNYYERVRINTVPVSAELFAKYLAPVKAAIHDMTSDGLLSPTVFEAETAVALLAFAGEACDISILETGLGGRLDSTNVIDAPLAAVITSVSYDHMAILGDTLEKIAFEKCGIIKPGTDVISYGSQPEPVRNTIAAAADAKNSQLRIPDMAQYKLLSSGIDGSEFTYKGETYKTGIAGEHFVLNSLAVIETAEALRSRGIKLPQSALYAGISGCREVARMELAHKSPTVLLDGAHNPDAMDKLCASVDGILKGKRIITVMGMLADKDYAYCIPQMARRSDVFIATTPSNSRALPAQSTAEKASGLSPLVCVVQNPRKSLALALRFAGEDDCIICCGSFSFLGDCRRFLSAYFDKK